MSAPPATAAGWSAFTRQTAQPAAARKTTAVDPVGETEPPTLDHPTDEAEQHARSKQDEERDTKQKVADAKQSDDERKAQEADAARQQASTNVAPAGAA